MTKKEAHYIILSGLITVFLDSQLGNKWAEKSGPFFFALWQPLVPVFVQGAVILLKLDHATPRKLLGVWIWVISVIIFVSIDNSSHDLYSDFKIYFFISFQIVLSGTGSVIIGQALNADNIGIFNLWFWIYIFASIFGFLYYSFQYTLEPSPPFFSYTYQLDLLRWGGIWVFLICIDVFGLSTFLHIARTGQISKAAIYGTLGALFTIIFGLIRSEYKPWIILYLISVYTGYSLINYDKKSAANKAKRSNIRIRFIQKIERDDYEVQDRQSITIGDNIDDAELSKIIGKIL